MAQFVRMQKTTLTLLFILLTSLLFSQTVWTKEALPNPKLEADDHYVCNPDNVLESSTTTAVNYILRKLEDSTTVQVAVVAVNSIGDAVPKDFATALFRYWGIGQKENNNGLLVLLVIDQRRMEFETGYGLEGILTDGICKRIQVEKMVPHAKESDYDAAVLEGINEISNILINPKYRDEVYSSTTAYYDPQNKPAYRDPVSWVFTLFIGVIYVAATAAAYKKNKKLTKKPAYVKKNFSASYYNNKYVLLNLLFPAAVVTEQFLTGPFRFGEFMLFAYAFMGVLLLEKRLRFDKYLQIESADKSPYDTYNLYSGSYKGWGAAGFFFPLPFIFMLINNRRRKNKLRNTPPAPGMILLDEKADDAFLKGYEITEETIKSVDYDVWKKDGSDTVTILRYPSKFTKYVLCSHCGGLTSYVSSKRTISAATYSSSGTGEKIYTCKFCNHTRRETFSIPKLTHSTSSSSGGYSGGGGGGGGFGGGSSGGGGAGSSW